MNTDDTLHRILDLARWAPSGDNTQPWRFELPAGGGIVIHGHDTRDWCLYDFDGHASHMAHGALLATLEIAASAFGLRAQWSLRPGSEERAPVYDVALSAEPGVQPHALLPFIEQRAVQRRPMRTTPLSAAQREALQQAVGEDYALEFFESFAARRAMAAVMWHNAHIRLTCPEAFAVHREIIEWGARYSADRIPERAVGVDRATGLLMRWVMQSWARVRFFNRFLLGTVPPRIQLDYIPALACSAHVLMRARRAPAGIEDHVRAGAAMQRMWLTVTRLGLHLQPEMTPVIFRWYVRDGRSFSADEGIRRQAAELAEAFERSVGAGAQDSFAFLCRIGESAPPWSRSLRQSLDALMKS
ncbi:nitroreductase family protein [Pseudothauera lacus]|uniref:Molybdopterin biosynthesis protein MoeY n=1 Tax=Pseudothauera lacus TaxID=2136175 RepID=A0A2T4IGP7_9RHOO|nr:nitroreductase family protein [Pseudothauera lacus]PTD96953.1 molybdopterin biosynthesis protein MoeY [Pseudothauera lacus]